MANIVNTTDSSSSKSFFNGYFTQPIQISDAVWDQVYNYFLGLTKDPAAANTLAQSVIALTHDNNLNPLTVLQQFQSSPNNSNIKNLLISFFNNVKGSTSKLGYKNNVTTSVNIARNIIQ
jgi:hypothetical protein